MIRGFMKTTSQTALALAAAGLLMSTYAPAYAADLGGGCCADLEERVAELEATTARKGNRVVSLQIYGQINKGLLIWDDGIRSDAFIVDDETSSSRYGFRGKATIAPGWTAGYNMEINMSDANSSLVTNGYGTGDDNDSAFVIRQNHWYIESDKLGRVSVGHQSDVADGAAEVVLGNSVSNSGVWYGTAMTLSQSGGTYATGTTLGDWANNQDGTRRDLIRYDSPAIYGFVLSTSWGENDYADVALRLKREFGNFRFVGGIGYAWASGEAVDGSGVGVFSDVDVEEVVGSASLMHVPTGLYIAFAAANRTFSDPHNRLGLSDNIKDQNYWYLQAGLEKKFNSLGSTTFYGEYGVYKNTLGAQMDFYTSPESTRWGLGANQKIDAAAMDVFLHANFWSFDHNTADDGLAELEDFSTIMVGSRIQF